jgi:predicted metal-binding protein
MTYLLICQTCHDPKENPEGHSLDAQKLQELQDDLDQAGFGERILVQSSPCLGVCADAHAIALTGKNRASLVFLGVDLTRDRADILATCHAWLAADQGWIDDARPCGRLRHQLQARIPFTD